MIPIGEVILKATGLVGFAAMLVHRIDIALNDPCQRLILAAVQLPLDHELSSFLAVRAVAGKHFRAP